MLKKYLTLIAFAAAMPAVAQETVDAVVARILDSNPTIVAADLGARADRLDSSDENSLADPQVALSRVWGMHHIGNKLQLDISQAFDWPGAYGARRHAADAALDAAMGANRAAALDLEMKVRALLNELIYTRRQISLLTELQANVQKLSEAVDRGVKGGELTAIDQRKTAISAYEIGNEISGVTAREQEIIGELAALSGQSLDLSAITAYPVLPLHPLQQYLDGAAKDPAVTALALEEQSQKAAAHAAGVSRMPGFSVGYQHQAEMGDAFHGFTVGMNLPVFQGRKARAAATLRGQAAAEAASQAKAAREAEIKAAYSALEIQRGRLEAYQRTFGDGQYPTLLLRAYQGGQMTVLEYIQEMHYYHQTMLVYLDAEFQYHQALTTLNR